MKGVDHWLGHIGCKNEYEGNLNASEFAEESKYGIHDYWQLNNQWVINDYSIINQYIDQCLISALTRCKGKCEVCISIKICQGTQIWHY